MPTKLNSDYTVFGMGIGIFFKPAAGLAQSVERLTAEREIIGIYSLGRILRNFLSITIVLSCFYLHIFYFEKFST